MATQQDCKNILARMDKSYIAPYVVLFQFHNSPFKDAAAIEMFKGSDFTHLILADWLIEKFSVESLAVIIGHELGHLIYFLQSGSHHVNPAVEHACDRIGLALAANAGYKVTQKHVDEICTFWYNCTKQIRWHLVLPTSTHPPVCDRYFDLSRRVNAL